jgi:hypothetical protein
MIRGWPRTENAKLSAFAFSTPVNKPLISHMFPDSD